MKVQNDKDSVNLILSRADFNVPQNFIGHGKDQELESRLRVVIKNPSSADFDRVLDEKLFKHTEREWVLDLLRVGMMYVHFDKCDYDSGD